MNQLNELEVVKEYLQLGAGVKTVARKFKVRRHFIESILIKNDVKIKTNSELKSELTGKNSLRYGLPPPIGAGHCRWYCYHNKKYQGTWEFMYGLLLEQQQIKFNVHEDVRQFRCKYDDGKEFTYCPDFYLIDDNRYVEVKGYFSEESKNRMRLFKEQYPDIDVAVIDKYKIVEIGAFDIQKKLNIDLELYQLDYENEKSVKKFINSIDQIEFVKLFIVDGLNLSELAQKYDVPYRVISHVYNLWVPDRNSKEYYEFILRQCKSDIVKDCELGLKFGQIVRKYKFRSNSKMLLNAIISWGAKINRLQEPGRKVIAHDVKQFILKDYEIGLSKRQICKKYCLRKKHVDRILVTENVQQRSIGYYTVIRHEKNRQQMIDRSQQNIIGDYKSGLSIRIINKKYGVSRNVIKRLLLENNIEVRPSATYSFENA